LPPARAPQEGHRVGDHRAVLGDVGAQRALDVAAVGLGDERDDRGLGVEQGADLRVLLGRRPRLARGPERDERGMAQGELTGRGPGEELGVAGVGAGPAALDEAHPEVVQVPCDGQLVGDGEVDALALGAVAQGGVEDVERVVEFAGFRHGVKAPVSDLGLYRNDRLHRPPMIPRAPFPA